MLVGISCILSLKSGLGQFHSIEQKHLLSTYYVLSIALDTG